MPKKIIIPKDQLPPVRSDAEAYLVKFRIVSEDRNRFSYWSPVFKLDQDIDYYSKYYGSIRCNVDKDTNDRLFATWDGIPGVGAYDLFFRATPAQGDLYVVEARDIEDVDNPGTRLGYIQYTMSVAHNLSEGQIIYEIENLPAFYNVTNVEVVTVVNDTTFIIRDTVNSISDPVQAAEGPDTTAHIYPWYYRARTTQDFLEGYKPEQTPKINRVDVHIQVAADPPRYNEKLLIAQAYQNV
jgi:hypothetical protein